ncbi:MAG: translation initiation factor IF-2 [Thermodesulfobacteriota bacterium]|nr:translation initiation factor IF-2 [Thermodesulfobacteriota bacterium]
MKKIRVYELAKDAGLDSKELAAKLIEMGYPVKAYNSTLDEETAEDVRKKLGIIKTKVEEKRIQAKGQTTIIRRRTKMAPPEEAPPPEAPPAPEEVPKPEPEEIMPAPVVAEEIPVPAEKIEAEVEVEKPEKKEAVSAEDEVKEVGEGVEAPEAAQPVPPTESAPEEVQPVSSAITDETKTEEKKILKKESELPPKRKGLARIIGKTTIPLPEERRPRPKKAPRPKKVKKVVVADKNKMAGGGQRETPPKGKKGKRFVKFTPEPGGARRGRGKRKGPVEVGIEDLGAMRGRFGSGIKIGRGMRGQKKKQKAEVFEAAETKAIKKRIKIFETISVGDLAHRMGIKANEIIGKLMGLGVMATLNQALDIDTATLVASDFGYEVEQSVTEELTVSNLDEAEGGGEELPRPPVVTVMGHVDHGKTSILDAIRNSDVAAGEAGGITQHIGAHYVRSPQGDLVFLDTPGHAAFTEMRSRGAKVTDVVILVVAADDGVMDQTREAINHAQAAEVPILVAVNKIDKEDADPARVQRELAELDLVPEEWGGDVIFCETSAKKGIGIDGLVENILLQTEILELKADPNRKAKGTVIEAQLHKGRGAVATVLIQHGTLHLGESFVVGSFAGKVRSLTNDKGKQVKVAGPSTPVEIQGLGGVPQAGDEFVVVSDDKMAKNVSASRQLKNREIELASTTKISLDNLFEKLQEGEVKELRVLLRADVQGTLEAFGKALEKLSTDEVKVKILHQGTGTIIESDILLASASDALIIGFNVRPPVKVQEMAKNEGVDLRFYDVIYHALDDIKKAMTGLLDPVFVEKVIGSAEVRETFHAPKVGTIAGCFVTEGSITRKAKVRLIRDGVVVFTGQIGSLRRFKDDVKEVQSGYECGIGIENYNDIKIGDSIEAFILEEIAAEL